MEYVADTHAIIWYYYKRQRLGATALTVLTDADAGLVKIFIPAVAVAEMIMIIQKGRLSGVTTPNLIAQLKQMQGRSNYEFLPLDPDLVIASHRLTAIPEIFDRLIVAEALRLGAPLITVDSVIRSSGLVNVIWN